LASPWSEAGHMSTGRPSRRKSEDFPGPAGAGPHPGPPGAGKPQRMLGYKPWAENVH
jgi:hypothetical protein